MKILCPTGWTLQGASLSAVLNNYGTLMQLWMWEQNNVSDPYIKIRIIEVQNKLQTFNIFCGLIFAILALCHSDNLRSSLQRAELCAMPSFLLLFFEVYD